MNNYNVLVVDNSPVIVKIVATALEEAGCSVQTASDGLEALDLLMEFPPDIIYTDLVMPRIDGAKLCSIVRNTPEYEHIFLVVLSGIALEDDMNIAELGADVCIAKGPAGTMKEHVLAALERFKSGLRGSTDIEGLQGLYPREVTSELLLHKRHNEVIFEQMTEGAVELDRAGRIVRANPVSCQLFQHRETEILGMSLAQLLPRPECDTFATWLSGLERQEVQSPLVFDYQNPVSLHGRLVTFNLTPVFEEYSVSVIGIMKDVTERKKMDERRRQLEQELQRIGKLDAMATMASGIAHDFNNLLTIINGNIEMAQILSQDSSVSQLLNETDRALQLTTGLIRRFSTFSDNYLPTKSLVCVDELIEGLLDNELADTDVHYTMTTNGEVSYVDLDADLMVQVFQNIVLNAVEAMQGKGTIEVELQEVSGSEEREETGHPLADGTFIRIRLTDTGCGIDPSLLDRVFDAYFSTKQKGTQKGMGLGLTIAHAIVKKHGGLIFLSSEPGQGCTATVYLPVGSNADQCHTKEQQAITVLIFEQDIVMQTILQKMFTEQGCQVDIAGSSDEAIRLASYQLQAGAPYDLALFDLAGDAREEITATGEKMMTLSPETFLVAMLGDTTSNAEEASEPFKSAVIKPFAVDTVEKLLASCSGSNAPSS